MLKTSSFVKSHFLPEFLSLLLCVSVSSGCFRILTHSFVRSITGFLPSVYIYLLSKFAMSFPPTVWDSQPTFISPSSSPSSPCAGVRGLTQTARGHRVIAVTCGSLVTAPMEDLPMFPRLQTVPWPLISPSTISPWWPLMIWQATSNWGLWVSMVTLMGFYWVCRNKARTSLSCEKRRYYVMSTGLEKMNFFTISDWIKSHQYKQEVVRNINTQFCQVSFWKAGTHIWGFLFA